MLRKGLAFSKVWSVTEQANTNGTGISPRDRGVLGSAATGRKALKSRRFREYRSHGCGAAPNPEIIRFNPNDRRHFIGGSDARIIMGEDQDRLIRLWRRNAARLNRKTYQTI